VTLVFGKPPHFCLTLFLGLHSNVPVNTLIKSNHTLSAIFYLPDNSLYSKLVFAPLIFSDYLAI